MRWLTNASFRFKLSLVPVLATVALTAVAAAAFWGYSRLGSALASLYEERLPSYSFAARLESSLRDMNGLVNQSIVYEALEYDAKQIEKIDKQIVALAREIEQSVQQRLAVEGLQADEREALTGVAKGYATYQKNVKDALDLKSAGLGTASTFLSTAQSQYVSLLKIISDLARHKLELAGQDVEAASASATRAKALMVGVALAMLALCALVSALVLRSMLGRMQALSTASSRLAGGDLTHRLAVEGEDEIGRLMGDVERMRKNFLDSLALVRAASEEVREAAHEIANGYSDLGSRTESTATSLQESAANLQELTHALHKYADAARSASRAAQSAAGIASRSGSLMSEVVQTMDRISKSSARIADITNVIDGISFQTNLLALNAAVEAARAGEQGRGFSVVASEVRALAQRSATAAREIKELIRDSVSKIEAGSNLVEQAGNIARDLVGEVNSASAAIAEISSASSEQSAGVAQINEAIAQVERVTQQNAALVEQSSAAAESLKQQSSTLSDAVGAFRVA